MRAMDYNLLKGYELDMAFSLILDPATQGPPRLLPLYYLNIYALTSGKKIRSNATSNTFSPQ
jgi:hypothetical protein